MSLDSGSVALALVSAAVLAGAPVEVEAVDAALVDGGVLAVVLRSAGKPASAIILVC
jgi:hypothetical protein